SIALANHFQNKLLSKHSDLFAISVEQAFALVCFHVIPNEKSRKTSNELRKRSPWTNEEHIDKALDLIVKITKEVIEAEDGNN
ncbi:9671_t:CDS:2, partial [Dentiscutata heterogama]